jgi:hypothetical protein
VFDDTRLTRAAASEDPATRGLHISTVALAILLSALAWALVIGSAWLLWHAFA